MTTTLVAAGRLKIAYTPGAGFTHLMHCYIRNVQLVGAVYVANSRATDANDSPVSDIVTAFIETFSYLWPLGTTVADTLLELRTGSVWNPAASYTFTGTNHAIGALWPASQLTVVLRDTMFRKVKVEILDTNQNALQHDATLTGGSAQMDSLLQQCSSGATLPGAPYSCLVGRGNTFLNTNPLVSWTIAHNRKLRRARGLA